MFRLRHAEPNILHPQPHSPIQRHRTRATGLTDNPPPATGHG